MIFYCANSEWPICIHKQRKLLVSEYPTVYCDDIITPRGYCQVTTMKKSKFIWIKRKFSGFFYSPEVWRGKKNHSYYVHTLWFVSISIVRRGDTRWWSTSEIRRIKCFVCTPKEKTRVTHLIRIREEDVSITSTIKDTTVKDEDRHRFFHPYTEGW